MASARCGRPFRVWAASPVSTACGPTSIKTRAPAAYTGTGEPGTLEVMKSTPFNIDPNSWVVTVVGSRLRMPAMASVEARAGSARCLATSSRTASMRETGSGGPRGTRKRAGTNWLPATSSVSAPLMLIGIPIRSPGTGASWAS